MSAAAVNAPARRWRRDALVAIAAAAGVTLLFAATPLDIAAAHLFYRPDIMNHWPLAGRLPWSVLYRMAPWITASLVLAGLIGLAVSLLRRRLDWRRQAIFVLLSVVLGPGLLVNAVFKDHWNRPRPRDIVEFGGPLHYVAAPLRGTAGASFPCGHCSVGFLYGLGWWLWRTRRPRRAAASLALGLLTGTALGLGRMAAGAHFLSDVVWSALLALGLAHALYHYVLRIPAHPARPAEALPGRTSGRRAHAALAALAAAGGAIVLLALFASPHGTQLASDIPLTSLPRSPTVFEVIADSANVNVIVVDTPAASVSVVGELHGFGLPTSRLRAHAEFAADPVPTLRYRIEQRGWFTDLDGAVAIRVPRGQLQRLVVRVHHGNIRVTDATRLGIDAGGRLQLDLRTAAGSVQRPAG